MSNDEHNMTRTDQLALEAKALPDGESYDLSAIDRWHDRIGVAPLHYQIARFTALGYSTYYIAGIFEMEVNAVRMVKGSPLFKAVVRELEGELDERVKIARRLLIEAAPEAATVKVNLLQSIDPKLRGDTASDILKGVGVVKQEGDVVRQNVFNIKADQAQLIISTLKELTSAKSE